MTVEQTASRTLTVCASVVVAAALMGLGYVFTNVYVGGAGVGVAFGLIVYLLIVSLPDPVYLDEKPDTTCPECGKRLFYESAVFSRGQEVCYRCARTHVLLRMRRRDVEDNNNAA